MNQPGTPGSAWTLDSPGVDRSGYAGPLSALRRLDARLHRAVEAAITQNGDASLTDPFHGLYVSVEQARRAARAPTSASVNGPAHGSMKGTPAATLAQDAPAVVAVPVEADADAADSGWDAICQVEPLWDWLRSTFGLSPFDLDIVLVALAPEVDRRYERAYAYLQDDVSRKLPSVDLMLDLCCTSRQEKIARRVHVSADSPLVQHRLVQFVPDPRQPLPTLLHHVLKLDEQLVALFLGQSSLDRRLTACATLLWPTVTLDAPALPPSLHEAQARWQQAQAASHPLHLYLHGPAGSATLPAAGAIAADLGVRLLHADMVQAVALAHTPGSAGATGDGTPVLALDQTLRLLLREAQFQDALLYLDGVDALRAAGSAAFELLLRLLAANARTVVLSGALPWPATTIPTQMLVVPFALPDYGQRRALWQAALAANGQELPAADLDALAARFRLTPAHISNAAMQVRYTEPTYGALHAAARAQASLELDGLAHKLTPLHTWDDLVLPPDALALLREMCQRVAHDQRVLDTWGFGRKLSLGKGVSALFAGPSGTGKTMAAEVIAHELGLDLYRIDLSTIVSKYIGETERNLERVFSSAENANVILFFDEADAIFGRRSEVRDSHDRYANLEISYLLQRMEQYDGLAILATNLRENMDQAFVRRLHVIVNFPLPDEAQRLQLWRGHLPPEAPYDADLDTVHLAARFRLSGGNIKNITLAAAFLAATDDCPIGMRHLLRAVQREHQKLGRVFTDADLAWGAGERENGNGNGGGADG